MDIAIQVLKAFPVIVSLLCGILMLALRAKHKACRYLIVGYFCCAAAMFGINSFYQDVDWTAPLMDCISVFCTLSAYICLYLYMRQMTTIEGTKSKDHLLFILPIFITVANIICYLIMGRDSYDYLRMVHDSGAVLHGSPTIYYVKRIFGSYLYRGAAVLEMIGVCVYSLFSADTYIKALHEYYSSVREDDRIEFRFTAISMALICVGTALFSMHPFDKYSTFYFIAFIGSTLVIMTAEFMLLLFGITHRLSINDLREQIVADDLKHAEEDALNATEKTMNGLKSELDALIADQFYLDPTINLISLASTLGTNRTYLSNLIHSEYDSNFSDFLNSKRVEYATQLMLSTKGYVDIDKISNQSGFNSIQSFYRNFKKFTGMAPNDYLNAKRA